MEAPGAGHGRQGRRASAGSAIDPKNVGSLSEVQPTPWLPIATAKRSDCAITPARYKGPISRGNVAHALRAIQPRNPPQESAGAQINDTHSVVFEFGNKHVFARDIGSQVINPA